jgi:hypothetical protein
MTSGWIIWQLSRMEQEKILREAQMFRVLEQGGSSRRKRHRGLCALLGKLDKLLVCWAGSSTFGPNIRWRWKTRGSP